MTSALTTDRKGRKRHRGTSTASVSAKAVAALGTGNDDSRHQMVTAVAGRDGYVSA